MNTHSWPTDGFSFGGDYSPEQWPEEIWLEDAQLMREAGVNLVSIGIFSWGKLEPTPGNYDFEWMQRALDQLLAHGVYADLATPTAAPPIWLHQLHPEIYLQDEKGVRFGQGARQAWCASSPVFRDFATRIVTAVAERFGGHPALRMWHINNELGCHNAVCYCDASAAAFRGWLEKKYATIDALNDSWNTAFWGQTYTDWQHVLPPRAAPTHRNPTHVLDYKRFSSDELLDYYCMERDILRRLTPDVPMTTNFMVENDANTADYSQWAPEMDIVANDHYWDYSHNLEPVYEQMFSGDRVRGLAGGDPWLLMEHSTSHLNWQARNRSKSPGNLLRQDMSHVAHGADGLLFFQWRASRAGAEKWHSGMLPHGGTDTKVWRETVELGKALQSIAEVHGSRVAPADVVMLFDHQSWWATQGPCGRPTVDFTYDDQPRRLHRALMDRGVAVDVVAPGGDLSAYKAVLIPNLYLTDDGTAAAVSAFVEAGGHALITYFSGIADESDQVRLGGYPGAFRDVLGIRVEEFFVLGKDETVRLDNNWTGDVWTELLHLDGATAVSSYLDGDLRGVPAVTRNDFGAGTAWYSATRLGTEDLQELMDEFLATAGIAPVIATRPGVEVSRRVGADASYLFVINHTPNDATIAVAGTDLLTGDAHQPMTTVHAGKVVVLRED